MTILAVVLAAGGGSRFHGATHKLLAPLRGRAVLEHAVEHAHEAALDETIVITGAVDVAVTVRFPVGVTVVHNARWADGQATSLQVAPSDPFDMNLQALLSGVAMVSDDLSQVAAVTMDSGPAQIDRLDRNRQVTLDVELGLRELGDVYAEAMKLPTMKNLPPSVRH